MAGCTDEDFTSPKCPGKGTSEQQLLNLVQCADSESEDSVVWSTCSMPATRTEIGPPAACTCKDSDDGILTGPKSFSQVASLPTAVGETISFQPGYTPKTKGGGTTVTATAADGQLTTITSEPTATGTAAAGDTGLSKVTKAGIGVGVTALVAALLALAAFMFLRYRRRHPRGSKAGGPAYHPAAPDEDMPQSPPPRYGAASSSPGKPYDPSPLPPHGDAAALGYAGYAGGGFKSELPAVPVEPKSAFVAELPADNAVSPGGHSLNRNATPSLLSMPGSPGHMSMVSDISRAPSNAHSMHSNHGDTYVRSPTTGNMAPIAELHG